MRAGPERTPTSPSRAWRTPGDGSVPVLMYHAIGTRPRGRSGRFVVDPGAFTEQMSLLRDSGYRSRTVGDLIRRDPVADHAERAVVITFDDAFDDFHAVALPILERFGLTATLFVPTAFVGGRAAWLDSMGEGWRRVLDWGALREVAATGIECGTHSHTHRHLDELDPAEIREEVARSRGLLEDHLGREVISLAYPHGHQVRATRSAVADAGIRVACAVSDVVLDEGSDPLAVPRLTVAGGETPEGFARLMRRRPSRGRRVASDGKRIAWWIVRRSVSRRPWSRRGAAVAVDS